MKALKVVVALGIAVSLTGGLAACSDPYSGEGVVVSKDIDETKKKKSSTSKKRSSSSSSSVSKDYEIVVDVTDSDKNRTISVTKTKYDSIKVGQPVQIENNKIR